MLMLLLCDCTFFVASCSARSARRSALLRCRTVPSTMLHATCLVSRLLWIGPSACSTLVVSNVQAQYKCIDAYSSTQYAKPHVPHTMPAR